ncbi:MAG: hypothetical protein ACTHQQ_13440 [Solirubrobacteraceae bacterium]
MSILQDTPPNRHRISGRPGTALALAALIATGLALLILMPTGHTTSAPTTTNIPHPHSQTAALAAQTEPTTGCFRDPTTHALTCYHAAPAPTATPAPAGYFRDPATHELLRLPTARHPARQQSANHSRGRIIP